MTYEQASELLRAEMDELDGDNNPDAEEVRAIYAQALASWQAMAEGARGMTLTERIAEAVTYCERMGAVHRLLAAEGARSERNEAKAESWIDAAGLFRNLLEERA